MLKYQQIANKIQKHIYDNELPEGTKLPTVENLALNFNVSKSTIVKALDCLVSNGVVFQVQGSGIFVRRRNKAGYINLNLTTGFTTTLKDSKITSKVLDFKLINPSKDIAQLLECSTNDFAYFIKRIRYIDGEIMCLEESYYKQSIVPYLTKEIVDNSIFEYLKIALNLNLGFSDRYLHIDKLDKDFANILKLNTGDPTLKVYEHIYLSSGLIFNYSILTYNYKHAQFYLQSGSLK